MARNAKITLDDVSGFLENYLLSDEKKWTFWQPTPFGVDVDDDDDFDDFDDDDDAADVIRRQRPKRLVVDEQETSSKCRSSQT